MLVTAMLEHMVGEVFLVDALLDDHT